jgi:endo-1,4-beta-mannosidase
MHPWKMFNIGEWDPQAVDYEMKLGASLGANIVRIFMDHPYSIDTRPLTPTPTATTTPRPTATATATATATPMGQPTPTPSFIPPTQQYVQNVRDFMDIAGKYDLKVILTLFDSLDWNLYREPNHWIAEEYVKQIVPYFANDTRIHSWDLQNEPDRAIVGVGAPAVIGFFKRVSAQIRKLDPNHLQTIGWIDRARARYFPDLDSYLDYWCFHFYDKVDNLQPLLQLYKSRTTKPVMLQEFGLPSGGPGYTSPTAEQDQVNHYLRVFALLDGYKMCGSVMWALMDFPQGLAGNPPDPNDSPENHFGVFRTDYSEKPLASVLRYHWKNA